MLAWHTYALAPLAAEASAVNTLRHAHHADGVSVKAVLPPSPKKNTQAHEVRGGREEAREDRTTTAHG